MSNELQPRSLGQVSAIFAGRESKDTLGAGIAASYSVMGYKGKVWSIRYRGEETPLLCPEGDPVGAIEAVIVASADHLSKIWYEGGYQEGNNAPPDCFCNDGMVPDASSPKKQNPVCATCPKNAWGSAINAATGGKGKACGDFKRAAIVPLADPNNEVFGGPMLLRIPAASLQDAASYADHCAKMGYQTSWVGTRISFSVKESYPKFQFAPIRALTDEEAAIVVKHQDSEMIKRVLAETPTEALTQIHPETVPGPTVVVATPKAPIAAPPPPKATSGFTSPAAKPAPVQAKQEEPKPMINGGDGTHRKPVDPAIAQVNQSAEEFEAALEARMAELMPPAKS